jgi:CheY-like chemotaxis protein
MALEALGTETFDLLVTDLRMQDMDGMEVLRLSTETARPR